MKAERCIVLCFAFAGDRLGGSHISLKGLLDELPKNLYRIVLVLEIPDGRIADYFSAYEQIRDPCALEKPFEVGRSFGIGSALRTVPRAIGRAKLLKDLQVDIVHTNDGRTHASWALAAKLSGARMVWHHRGDPGARGTGMVAPILADQILSVSDYALPARRWGKLKNAKVIHSPFDVDIAVDRDEMRRALVAELGCPENAIICSYFGQYIVRKRPVAFIDAVDELRKISGRPVAGVMFGEPEDAAVYAQMKDRLTREGRLPPVTLMGYREPGHKWIAACDVLLVTALNEPLGRTLVEAMLVGTPVIATRSGGNAEALAPDCGILVEPDDPIAMAEAAHKLVEKPARVQALTRRAREMAERRFTKDRHVEQVKDVYSNLIRKQRRIADRLRSEPGPRGSQPPRQSGHTEISGKH